MVQNSNSFSYLQQFISYDMENGGLGQSCFTVSSVVTLQGKEKVVGIVSPKQFMLNQNQYGIVLPKQFMLNPK